MIWSIVSKAEMEGFGTSPVFRFYREALGKNNIKLAVVEENDKLDFVGEGDIVLLRSANPYLVKTIKEKGVRTTAEYMCSYEMVANKSLLSTLLANNGIEVPRQYSINEVEEGKTYFVKPKLGSDSMGISLQSICRTIDEVKRRVAYIKEELGDKAVIEDFVEGVDCTVACWKKDGVINTCAIEVECEETSSIQTRDCKVGFKEYCSALHDEAIDAIAKNVFELLGIKHHARIDFRRGNDGKYYLIDVNLLAGLGPIDHFAKCLLLSRNMSYTDAMWAIVNTATTLK